MWQELKFTKFMAMWNLTLRPLALKWHLRGHLNIPKMISSFSNWKTTLKLENMLCTWNTNQHSRSISMVFTLAPIQTKRAKRGELYHVADATRDLSALPHLYNLRVKWWVVDIKPGQVFFNSIEEWRFNKTVKIFSSWFASRQCILVWLHIPVFASVFGGGERWWSQFAYSQTLWQIHSTKCIFKQKRHRVMLQ